MKDRVQKMFKMYQDKGISMAKVGKKYSISKQRVHQLFQEAGFQRRKYTGKQHINIKNGKKKCIECKKIKSLNNFYYIKTRKYYHSHCNDCKAKLQKEWRARRLIENPDYERKQYQQHREQRIEKARKYRENNREAYNRYYREYYHKRRQQ